MRYILHSDFNCFYASVECFLHPEISDRPVAVVGDPEKRHGIVLAKNGIAKEYGIKTGETIWSAQKKCPDICLMPPHFDTYLEFSQKAFNMYLSYTPRVEPFGLDECWLDISDRGMDFKKAEEFAYMLKERIKAEIGITVSVGVSFTKTFAKLASDMKKPDAVTVISDTNYKEKAWSQPVEDLLYVGRATKMILHSHGINTIGELANAPKYLPEKWLGKMGRCLYEYANGLDDTPVSYAADKNIAKSIGNSTTTEKDITNFDDAEAVIYALADKVAGRLRMAGQMATTLSVTVKDTNLISCDRRTKLPFPTNITSEIAEEAVKLFRDNFNPCVRHLRLIGISTSQLVNENSPHQTSLFEDVEKRQRQTALDDATDRLRNMYGTGIVMRASTTPHLSEDTHCFFRHHKADDEE